jgi:hypothetical protein
LWLASGPVRGFGVILTGVAVSMFTAHLIVRLLIDLVTRSSWDQVPTSSSGMGVGGRMRASPVERQPNLIGRSRRWSPSLLADALAVADVVSRGLRYGVESTAELRRKALLALAAQLIYLAERFRWNYGLSEATTSTCSYEAIRTSN